MYFAPWQLCCIGLRGPLALYCWRDETKWRAGYRCTLPELPASVPPVPAHGYMFMYAKLPVLMVLVVWRGSGGLSCCPFGVVGMVLHPDPKTGPQCPPRKHKSNTLTPKQQGCQVHRFWPCAHMGAAVLVTVDNPGCPAVVHPRVLLHANLQDAVYCMKRIHKADAEQ